ncbi:MAG: cytochrome P450 [Burkholderia sp.]|nr:cytochrome P450 [Burkholderia sp.]
MPLRPTAPLPLWRVLLQLRRNAIGTWGEPAYHLDVMSGRFLGRKSVIINAPDAIRRVLVDNHAAYGRTPATLRIIRPLLGEEGLFLAEGAAWRHQRRLVAPAFAPRRGETHRCAAARDAGQGHPRQRRQRPDDSTAGGRRRQRGDGEGRDDPLAWLRNRAGRAFKDVLDRIIAERGRTPPADPPRDLFDVLVAARDPETCEPCTPDQLRDQIATLIIAGHETTALSLFWSFYLLALDPLWQERVAEEAATVDLSPEGAAAAADKLPVARAVVQEALRLYPPAFTIVRLAKERDELAGEEVPPGTLVVISPWLLHRHRKLWQDPDAFDPSRFLPGAPPVGRYAYLPFGIGPRVCVGAQFALLEASLVLATLVRAFRVELPASSRRVLPAAVVTTAPERAIPFRLVPR